MRSTSSDESSWSSYKDSESDGEAAEGIEEEAVDVAAPLELAFSSFSDSRKVHTNRIIHLDIQERMDKANGKFMQ